MYSSVGVLAITSDHQLDAVLTYHAGDKSLAYCLCAVGFAAPQADYAEIEELILDIPDISALDAQRLLRYLYFSNLEVFWTNFPTMLFSTFSWCIRASST
ncbi:hypothetical protein HGRIS_011959 [Hohenbuehelia grisea]|uniref:Uncharacterized protein n=1 Tax=Hohenbuehelia grisea TaxID=104357 RepID=A0ABR3JWN4_9AGAR